MLHELSQAVKKNKFIFFFLVIAATIRLIWLDRFPVGMTHDELEYVFNSKSYFLTGHDLSGVGFPLSLIKTQTEGIISALPAIILAPYYGLLNLNQLTARLPYVLLNLATAYVLFNICKHLFKDIKTSLIISLVFLLSPWSIYLARQVSDVAWALFFYLLGINFSLKKESKNLILSLLFFTLGFLSYHGAKLLFPPLIFIILFNNLQNKTINRLLFIKFLSVAMIIFLGYFTISILVPDSIINTRKGDLVLNTDFSQTVDATRKSFILNPLTNVYENKVTLMINTIVSKYLTSFSPDVLFISGDTRATYRFEYHGLLYLIDLILIPVGLLSLVRKQKNELIFILSLLLIAPVSTALSVIDTSVINRSFLLLPLFSVLSGLGISYLLKLKVNYIMRLRVGSGLILFALLVMNFLVFYFFRLPISAQENYFLSEKIVARYVRLTDRQVEVITQNPRDIYLESVFYSNEQNRFFGEYLKTKELALNKTTFLNQCPKDIDSNTTYVVNTSSNCNLSIQAKEQIINQKDAGSIFLIYNDNYCNSEPLSLWQRFHKIEDYNFTVLNKSTFCQKWIASKSN